MSDTETFEELYTMSRERAQESTMGFAVFLEHDALTESALFVELLRRYMLKEGDGLRAFLLDKLDRYAQSEADRMQFNQPARKHPALFVAQQINQIFNEALKGQKS